MAVEDASPAFLDGAPARELQYRLRISRVREAESTDRSNSETWRAAAVDSRWRLFRAAVMARTRGMSRRGRGLRCVRGPGGGARPARVTIGIALTRRPLFLTEEVPGIRGLTSLTEPSGPDHDTDEDGGNVAAV